MKIGICDDEMIIAIKLKKMNRMCCDRNIRIHVDAFVGNGSYAV